MKTLHVGLRVSDLQRSLGFYTTLGYDVIGTVPETGFGTLTMLQLPGDDVGRLELVHDADAGAVTPAGINHLVVQVEDLRGTVDRLAAAGISAEEPASPDGSDTFLTTWLVDPDGYRIELVQWPQGHADGLTQQDFR